MKISEEMAARSAKIKAESDARKAAFQKEWVGREINIRELGPARFRFDASGEIRGRVAATVVGRKLLIVRFDDHSGATRVISCKAADAEGVIAQAKEAASKPTADAEKPAKGKAGK